MMQRWASFASLQKNSISHLDVFKIEGHFTVFTVECSCLTFSFIMSVFLCTKDKVLAGLALNTFKFTATFVLSLEMEDRFIILTTFLQFVLPTQDRCVWYLSFKDNNKGWHLLFLRIGCGFNAAMWKNRTFLQNLYSFFPVT